MGLVEADRASGTSRTDEDERLISSLPASYRTADYDLDVPSADVIGFVAQELDLRSLKEASTLTKLRLARSPGPPRPLHYQLLIWRQVSVTELMESHLVTAIHDRLFIKPLPRYLLVPYFWAKYLTCQDGCDCVPGLTFPKCQRRQLYECALGFLYSYAGLISYEIDFRLAKERHLIPEDETLSWEKWRTLVHQVLTGPAYKAMHPRFMYGELPSVHVNAMNGMGGRSSRFSTTHNSDLYDYSSLAVFSRNYKVLATATVFIAVLLTAMQVGLATTNLKDNGAFNAVCYGFTIFSIAIFVGYTGVGIINVAVHVVTHGVTANKFRLKRLRHLDEIHGHAWVDRNTFGDVNLPAPYSPSRIFRKWAFLGRETGKTTDSET